MSAVENTTTGSLTPLKRIVASKGKITGNYYAIAGKNAEGIAITLTAKDPKGAKALNAGKAMKKEVQSGRYSRGTIGFQDGKLTLFPAQGNLSAGNLKKKLKTGFGQDALRKFLAKARVSASAEEAAKLSDAERAELEGETLSGAEEQESRDGISADELDD